MGETIVRRFFSKTWILKTPQNSQKNTCAGAPACHFIKNDFPKFFKSVFLKSTSGQLHLNEVFSKSNSGNCIFYPNLSGNISHGRE